MQPIIAITAGEIINYDTGQAWTPVVYGQFRTYTDAVVRAGGAPFVIPLVKDDSTLRRLYEQCDGLLLSGGHDLDPVLYEGDRERVTMHISSRRDRQEIQLLRWALEDDKPILGICRGMQLINVALGGSLHQDIGQDVKKARNHTANIERKDFHHLAHSLKVAPGSRLAGILETVEVPANSLHHQAIDRLGEDLIVTAHAEDGVIEAIELPGKRFVIGIQSHPEVLEAATEPLWQKLFVEFLNHANRV